MNYSGHEVLRKEVALLVEKMDMFYMQLFEFERKYLYNADELTELLAAQLIKPIKNQMQEIYQPVIALMLFLNQN
ncbi:hypothetical protein E3U36_12150 (plasmid) [Arsenophonus endosymbiont of Aphis craccivora]|uniref:hypothetical protein n=1 Tax=Arsenophonus endosymbiont of Aphis craccivora TaxID=1231049 RepID=UPI0015DCEA2C|nr:hypothetical protein [Arsenophonus endosymbiont of Aphis craccivora]QLK88767.1 hypothetical protein E3U36_12150 [Arsenophonus endosymbiont of Aphis craccivora]